MGTTCGCFDHQLPRARQEVEAAAGLEQVKRGFGISQIMPRQASGGEAAAFSLKEKFGIINQYADGPKA